MQTSLLLFCEWWYLVLTSFLSHNISYIYWFRLLTSNTSRDSWEFRTGGLERIFLLTIPPHLVAAVPLLEWGVTERGYSLRSQIMVHCCIMTNITPSLLHSWPILVARLFAIPVEDQWFESHCLLVLIVATEFCFLLLSFRKERWCESCRRSLGASWPGVDFPSVRCSLKACCTVVCSWSGIHECSLTIMRQFWNYYVRLSQVSQAGTLPYIKLSTNG